MAFDTTTHVRGKGGVVGFNYYRKFKDGKQGTEFYERPPESGIFYSLDGKRMGNESALAQDVLRKNA